MMQGRVAEEGPPRELANREEGLYARFLKMQALGLDGKRGA